MDLDRGRPNDDLLRMACGRQRCRSLSPRCTCPRGMVANETRPMRSHISRRSASMKLDLAYSLCACDGGAYTYRKDPSPGKSDDGKIRSSAIWLSIITPEPQQPRQPPFSKRTAGTTPTASTACSASGRRSRRRSASRSRSRYWALVDHHWVTCQTARRRVGLRAGGDTGLRRPALHDLRRAGQRVGHATNTWSRSASTTSAGRVPFSPADQEGPRPGSRRATTPSTAAVGQRLHPLRRGARRPGQRVQVLRPARLVSRTGQPRSSPAQTARRLLAATRSTPPTPCCSSPAAATRS